MLDELRSTLHMAYHQGATKVLPGNHIVVERTSSIGIKERHRDFPETFIQIWFGSAIRG